MQREKLVVGDGDVNFANAQDGASVDLIDRMKVNSSVFYLFMVETGDECAAGAAEFGSEEYADELNNYLETMNFFLKAVWSARGGYLQEIPAQNFSHAVERMGRAEYQIGELLNFFDVMGSVCLIGALIDRLQNVELYTRCRLLLNMRIIMDAMNIKCAY